MSATPIGTTREEARRNTRARFEQWAKNPSCRANTISAVHNVRLSEAAKAADVPTTFGQSPFAMAHGDQFERGLFFREGQRLIEALVEKDVLGSDAKGLLDLRLKMNGGTRIVTLDESIEATRVFIRGLANAGAADWAGMPAVVAGATVRIPRGVMLPEANLIIDALVVRTDADRPQLVVGEIKTYPDRGGYTSTRDLSGARAQAGIYLHALELILSQEGLEDQISLCPTGFLVLTRPGSNRPSIRAGEDLRYQAARAKRGFELLEQAAVEIPSIEQGASEEDLIQAVLSAPTAYTEACLSFCDLAARCFEAAANRGDAMVLGEDVRRFLGEISLLRAMELLDGGEVASEAEADLVRRISEIEGFVA